MSNAPADLVLEMFRTLREQIGVLGNQLTSLRDEMRFEFKELKFRVGVLEHDMTVVRATLVSHSSRFEHIEGRLERIERRLELRDAE